MRTITLRQMRAAVRRVAARHPERRNQTCEYVILNSLTAERSTGCLIGAVLHDEFGASMDTLAVLNNIGAFSGARVTEVLEEVGLHVTPSAMVYARHAQGRQDMGWPWAKVVEYIERS